MLYTACGKLQYKGRYCRDVRYSFETWSFWNMYCHKKITASGWKPVLWKRARQMDVIWSQKNDLEVMKISAACFADSPETPPQAKTAISTAHPAPSASWTWSWWKFARFPPPGNIPPKVALAAMASSMNWEQKSDLLKKLIPVTHTEAISSRKRKAYRLLAHICFKTKRLNMALPNGLFDDAFGFPPFSFKSTVHHKQDVLDFPRQSKSQTNPQ